MCSGKLILVTMFPIRMLEGGLVSANDVRVMRFDCVGTAAEQKCLKFPLLGVDVLVGFRRQYFVALF